MYSYMFEIVLVQDYEDIFFFREFEVNGLSNNASYLSPNRRSPDKIKLSPHKEKSGSNSRSRSRSPNKQVIGGGNIMITEDGSRIIYQSPNKDQRELSPDHNKVTRII